MPAQPERPRNRRRSQVRALGSQRATMIVLTDLDAFYTDHRLCGDLDAGVDGPVVWFACACGVRIARRADETTPL